jgi:phosphatidylserine/phosphatidylglycerophosphate/cardiolipin synthase-like enzyme
MYEFLEEPLIFESGAVHHQSYRAALWKALIKSRRSIRACVYVASFDFKRPGHPANDIINVVLTKHRSKQGVFFIIDGVKKGATNRRPARLFEGFLKKRGIPCAVQQGPPTLHLKFFLIDEERLFIGSQNLTKSSLRSPLEMAVEIFNPDLGARLAKQYDQLFQVVNHG